MARRFTGYTFAYFLAGIGFGAVLALLYAPRSGEETREAINQKVEEGKAYVAGRGKEIRRKAEDVVVEGKRKMQDLSAQGKDFAAKIGIKCES
ncbi:MAG: YtxH domain-containing protein [Terriglobia bacterium]